MTRSICPALGAAALTAALCACSGAPQLTPQTQAHPATPLVRHAASSGASSWMAKDAAGQNLLYVADNGAVDVYSYPWGKLEGTLTNVQDPSAICTDEAGHVFVVESALSQIVEYDHAGTKPIATLKDPNYWASHCAVNPITGDLAVANVFLQNGGQGTPGNLVIYKKAKGNPQTFTTASVENYMYLGYDDSGNLFVDGMGPSNFEFALAELPSGKSSLTPVELDQAIPDGGAGDVAWDGRYLAIADASSDTIYQFSIRKGRGIKAGATAVTGVASGYFGTFSFAPMHRQHVQARRLIIPFDTNVAYWSYPTGGGARKYVTRSLTNAQSAAVSRAQ